MENNTKKEAAGKPIITTIVFGIVLLFLGITYIYAMRELYLSGDHSIGGFVLLFGWFIIATIATILVMLKTWKLIRSNNITVLISLFAILIGVLYISPILFIVLGGLFDKDILYGVSLCIYKGYYICKLW